MNPWGRTYAYGLGKGLDPGRVPLTFGFTSETTLLEFEREVIERSVDGSPLMIVPDDTTPEVHFVRGPERMDRPRTGFSFYETQLLFKGFPLPLVVS